jgi:hypothetical protein
MKRRALAVLIPVTLMIAICSAIIHQSTRERRAFDRVMPGMTSQQVEVLLGKPKVELDDTAYYGSVPRIEMWQSPQSLYRVEVHYSENRVVEKIYFEDQARSRLRRSADAVWQTLTNLF